MTVDDKIVVDNKERDQFEVELLQQSQQSLVVNVDDSTQLTKKLELIDIQLKQIKYIRIDLLDLFKKSQDHKDNYRYLDQEIAECIKYYL